MKRKTTQYNTPDEISIPKVEEAIAPYYAFSSTVFPFIDTQTLIQHSRTGIPMQRIIKYMNLYDISLKEMAAILNLSERTLQRYNKEDILSKDASDRALHLQRLYTRGAEVFGTLDNFKNWMKSSILIFENEKPISFLDTIFGFELLEQELGRIEHGIFA
ncbi:MAG: hypothetical protein RJA25_1573 [Bacteroidota bacterium]|jgi:putative toxin-antitoxin system antitoxin component (TIGR02293 family)